LGIGGKRSRIFAYAGSKEVSLMTVQAEKKTMFEIYRDAEGNGEYKVIYFTELDDHNKETEIGAAMRGEHVFNGFLLNQEKAQGKRIVATLIDRLNRGERFSTADIERELQAFLG
jgi:hypothetical protein